MYEMRSDSQQCSSSVCAMDRSFLRGGHGGRIGENDIIRSGESSVGSGAFDLTGTVL